MANTNYSLEDLIRDSLAVTDATLVVCPQLREGHRLHVEEMIPKFTGCFSTNNSTVSFICNGMFYVTPYTRHGMEALRSAGFRKKDFYVPFSNYDYPKYEQMQWQELRNKARRSYMENFHSDCETYCDEHHIAGPLSSETLENCFLMPQEGVWVKHIYCEDCYYPLNFFCTLDSKVISRLGHFNTNNGKVVFVYRDGNTYVTKGYGILRELKAAGYKESMLFVPFSNGEQILDPVLKERWEEVKKFK